MSDRRPTWIYLLRPGRLGMVTEQPTIEEFEALGHHLDYLEGLANAGQVLMFGRTGNDDEGMFGLVVFEADSAEDATALMNDDPAVSSGVLTAQLFPYRLAHFGRRDVS